MSNITLEDDPMQVKMFSSDQMCISNTFLSLIFTIMTFSSACSFVVATQLINEKTKEDEEQNIKKTDLDKKDM